MSLPVVEDGGGVVGRHDYFTPKTSARVGLQRHCTFFTVDQIDRLNKLTPAAGARHNEANMAAIDR